MLICFLPKLLPKSDHIDATSPGNHRFLVVKRGATDMFRFIALSIMALGLAACGETWGQRAVTGGGIGAGTGALLGAVTPIGVLPGALVGGAVGAGVGAGTAPRR
jgi:osmotically inducible lipoprotein OsmB